MLSGVLAQVVAGAGASASGCGNECEWLRVWVRGGIIGKGAVCGARVGYITEKGCELALRKGRKLTRLIGVRACGRMYACGSI